MFSVRSNGILMCDVQSLLFFLKYFLCSSPQNEFQHFRQNCALPRRPKSGRNAALQRQSLPQTLNFSSPLHPSISVFSIVLPSSLSNASPLFPASLTPEGQAGTAWEPVNIFFLLKNCKWSASYCTHAHTHTSVSSLSPYVLLLRFKL